MVVISLDVLGLVIPFPLLPRLFGTLFRLLRMLASSRVGSAQLTEDTLWVFVRLTLTYFSCDHFAGPEGHLDPVSRNTPNY